MAKIFTLHLKHFFDEFRKPNCLKISDFGQVRTKTFYLDAK